MGKKVMERECENCGEPVQDHEHKDCPECGGIMYLCVACFEAPFGDGLTCDNCYEAREEAYDERRKNLSL